MKTRNTRTSTANSKAKVEAFFRSKKWKIFPFQKMTWDAYLQGKSGLVHAPTGTGKTYAVWVPPLLNWMDNYSSSFPHKAPPLKVLWLTPLRALVEDTKRSLCEIVDKLELPWTVEARTGDTSGNTKVKQRKKFPSALVTTPESLSLLLSYPDTIRSFSELEAVIVDEWHELLSSKRGTQTELGLARLRKWNPKLRIWGLSATLGNLEQAMKSLLGNENQGQLINGEIRKKFVVKTIIPKNMEKFPWAGHLGGRLVEQVAKAIEKKLTTLVFTNVRSQTEYWFDAILSIRPHWKEQVGIHHGSIDRKQRTLIEKRLKNGEIKAVVCTSSLDLGVDFSPVEQVIQIGGPKGVARLLQRAGRSGHQPGAISSILCVPTQAMELLEYAAARKSIVAKEIEAREPLKAPLDLLSQHLITLALGGGFKEEETLSEVKSTWSYRNLSLQEWKWTMEFIKKGGKTLGAYDQFKRVVLEDGLYQVQSRRIARFHRMSIGTITSDPSIIVKFQTGKKLGSVEESFISRIQIGSNFFFSGKLLTLIRVRELTAVVRLAKTGKGTIPVWGGGKSPLSSELAKSVRKEIEMFRLGKINEPEIKALEGILSLQQEWSYLPSYSELLIEKTITKDGNNWFLFPFAGRLAHEGLASLIAYRMSKLEPMTLSISFNDYGLNLTTNSKKDLTITEWQKLLTPDDLIEELLDCMNRSEMAKRQFRDVARVAGLIFQGYPGAQKSIKQVQASGGLFFDVFSKYDPENLLLVQARKEVLERQLEAKRLIEKLTEIKTQKIVLKSTRNLTPFSFPLWAESLRTQVTSESWSDRVQRMAKELEDKF
ncbi:MAG: DNA ligase-associated DEXH box helicase [Opitutae bacterium]|nr:DNA ligase-associated DEXH box helicase [Opitutae bacterium]